MKLRLVPLVLMAAACSGLPGAEGGSGGDTTSTSEGTDESDESTAGKETGTDAGEDDEIPRACPYSGDVHPRVIEAYSLPINPNFSKSCTVHAIAEGGEGFWLACPDDGGQSYYQFAFDLAPEGEPELLPFEDDQPVELEVVSGPAFAWTIRDQAQRLLMLYYEGAYLPGEDPQGQLTLEPEFFAPLSIASVDGACPRTCEEDPGFLPQVCFCHRRLGVAFELETSSFTLFGGERQLGREGRAIVWAAYVYDDCPEAEIESYSRVELAFVANP